MEGQSESGRGGRESSPPGTADRLEAPTDRDGDVMEEGEKTGDSQKRKTAGKCGRRFRLFFRLRLLRLGTQ